MSLQLLTAALDATGLPASTRKKTEGLLEMMRLCVIEPVKRETSARRAVAELELRLSIAIFFKNELTATLAALPAANGSAPRRAPACAPPAPRLPRARAERELEIALASYQAGTEL
jgi:hypothetical protein